MQFFLSNAESVMDFTHLFFGNELYFSSGGVHMGVRFYDDKLWSVRYV